MEFTIDNIEGNVVYWTVAYNGITGEGSSVSDSPVLAENAVEFVKSKLDLTALQQSLTVASLGQ
jgi:hypothetical protein